MSVYEAITYGMVGLGLAASCGFRVFVPMLFMSVAVHTDVLELADGWEWIGSWPAVASFATATLIEVAGFFIPWVDNLLDAAASPAAVVAGVVAGAACLSRTHPALQWSLAIVAGGGAAGLVQSGTVLARGASTAITGGLGNWFVAISELVMSAVTAIIAIALPALACLLFVAFAVLTVLLFIRRRRQRLDDPLMVT